MKIVEDSRKIPATRPPQVLPRLHSRTRLFLDNRDFVLALVRRYGSPLNVVFPQNLENNIRDFEEIYKKHRLRGRIYYVTKPCKSRALMREARQYDIGIDVSSDASLQEVLRLCWDTDRIVANGPKNNYYLKTAVQNKILINADSIEELHKITALARGFGVKASIGIRLCDFQSSAMNFTPHDNTFGIRMKHLDWILDFLISNQDAARFYGFSFHMAGNNDEQKIVAIENLIQASFKAIKRGLKPRSINIGGGYPIMYADKCQEWHDYQDYLKQSVINATQTGIWDNGGMGFKMQNGFLSGSPAFMDHAPFRAKGESLDYLLSVRLASFNNNKVSDILRDTLLGLDIEPGKSMLDQCGVTLGAVLFTKESSLGENLVGVDMNRSNIQAAEQKILTSPVVIYQHENLNDRVEAGVFYMGNLCLSYDLLQYNKTYPDFMPREGDVIAFPNTAPYSMDFAESESLMQPLAKKIAVTADDDGWKHFPDEDYNPLQEWESAHAC